MPQQTAQLVWLGLSPGTLAALENFITLLPEATAVNLNTAPAEVLMASLPGLDLSAARQLVALRERGHWSSVEAARKAMGAVGQNLQAGQHEVQSRYFEVTGRMRIDDVVQVEQLLVKRDGNQVQMVWRVRRPVLVTRAP
jgi:general secretion pathway protein K